MYMYSMHHIWVDLDMCRCVPLNENLTLIFPSRPGRLNLSAPPANLVFDSPGNLGGKRGPSNARVWTCIAGVQVFKIAIFEGWGFLGYLNLLVWGLGTVKHILPNAGFHGGFTMVKSKTSSYTHPSLYMKTDHPKLQEIRVSTWFIRRIWTNKQRMIAGLLTGHGRYEHWSGQIINAWLVSFQENYTTPLAHPRQPP